MSSVEAMHFPLSFPCPADFRAYLQISFCPTLSPVIESFCQPLKMQ